LACPLLFWAQIQSKRERSRREFNSSDSAALLQDVTRGAGCMQGHSTSIAPE
jgi:hypothetical protein